MKRIMNKIDAFYMIAAIHKHGGKRKAAESMGLSVDTLNKYVEELEGELGIRLLIINSKGCSLTPFAQKIVSSTNNITDIIDSTFHDIPKHGDLQGEVNVCMTNNVLPNIELWKIDAFMDEFPQININSTVINNRNDFANYNYDIGMCFSELPDRNKVLLYQVPVRFKLFASPEYLATYGYPRNIEDMKTSFRLLNKTTDRNIKPWNEIMKNAANIRFSSNSSSFLIKAIACGAGIGLLPKHYEDKGLVCLDNFEYNITEPFYLFADAKTKDIPRVRMVIDYLKQHMKEM